jgi:hypothetical protein
MHLQKLHSIASSGHKETRRGGSLKAFQFCIPLPPKSVMLSQMVDYSVYHCTLNTKCAFEWLVRESWNVPKPIIHHALLGSLSVVLYLFLLLCWAGIISIRRMPFLWQWPNIMVTECYLCNNIVRDLGQSMIREQRRGYRNQANERREDNNNMRKIKWRCQYSLSINLVIDCRTIWQWWWCALGKK